MMRSCSRPMPIMHLLSAKLAGLFFWIAPSQVDEKTSTADYLRGLPEDRVEAVANDDWPEIVGNRVLLAAFASAAAARHHQAHVTRPPGCPGSGHAQGVRQGFWGRRLGGTHRGAFGPYARRDLQKPLKTSDQSRPPAGEQHPSGEW